MYFLIVGEIVIVKGEVVVDDVVVNGCIVGCVCGLKVCLMFIVCVEGDIIYKIIVIESGVYFEGFV